MNTDDKIIKSEDEWKQQLTEEQYYIRNGGTEPPFSGKYWNDHSKGVYRCSNCGYELFGSDTKFDSGSGWPSFTDPVNREHITLKEDMSHGMSRVEVRCKRCNAHLGHVFDDGPGPNGKRYCINSASLDLETKE